MNKLYTHSFKTRLGTIYTAATEKGLALVSLPGQSRRDFDGLVSKYYGDSEIREGGVINRTAEKQLKRYLDGKLKRFDIKLDIQGTDFQKKTLKRVASIPYGKTMTYGEIARAVGNISAARAVGSVNASNRLPIIVPCHRVVATSGLGGYGGGLPMKKKLLKMEGALE